MIKLRDINVYVLSDNCCIIFISPIFKLKVIFSSRSSVIMISFRMIGVKTILRVQTSLDEFLWMFINHCHLQFIASTASNRTSSGNITGVFS